MEMEIPLGTNISIAHSKGELEGRVRYCVYRDIGYFLGIQFEPGVKWTQGNYRPMYLFDPSELRTSDKAAPEPQPTTR
jgi:hypothetical protein